jgi:beta-lactamase class A
MMCIMRCVHEGRWRAGLNHGVKVAESSHVATALGSGVLHYMRPNLTVTIWDLLVLMIIVSDNTATGILTNLAGGATSLNKFCNSVGMHHTIHRYGAPPTTTHSNNNNSNNNESKIATATSSVILSDFELRASPSPNIETLTCTTAEDQTHLLSLILRAARQPIDTSATAIAGGGNDDSIAAQRILGCDGRLCRSAVDILSWQKDRKRLASFMPEDSKVASKSG